HFLVSIALPTRRSSDLGNHRAGQIPARPFMEKIDGLTGLTDKIAARLATKPEIFIIHPAELRILRSMSDQDLRAFAAENGWRVRSEEHTSELQSPDHLV